MKNEGFITYQNKKKLTSLESILNFAQTSKFGKAARCFAVILREMSHLFVNIKKYYFSGKLIKFKTKKSAEKI